MLYGVISYKTVSMQDISVGPGLQRKLCWRFRLQDGSFIVDSCLPVYTPLQRDNICLSLKLTTLCDIQRWALVLSYSSANCNLRIASSRLSRCNTIYIHFSHFRSSNDWTKIQQDSFGCIKGFTTNGIQHFGAGCSGTNSTPMPMPPGEPVFDGCCQGWIKPRDNWNTEQCDDG